MRDEGVTRTGGEDGRTAATELAERAEPERVIVLDEGSRERDVADLIGAVSHEMRTPLTAISGYAATMRAHWDELAREDKLGFLEVIERQATRLSRLTSDLLSLSKVDAGRLETELDDVAVAPAIAHALLTLPELDGDVRLRGDTTVVVRVDPFHLEELVVNLITNAAKYGAPPITVEVSREDDVGVIRVRDEGEGVPEGFVARMWDRFARARSAERPAGAAGSGLGLAVVAGVAAANLGRVWYERNEPTGACFCLAFPLVTRPD